MKFQIIFLLSLSETLANAITRYVICTLLHLVVRFKHRTGVHNNFHDIMYLIKYQKSECSSYLSHSDTRVFRSRK